VLGLEISASFQAHKHQIQSPCRPGDEIFFAMEPNIFNIMFEVLLLTCR